MNLSPARLFFAVVVFLLLATADTRTLNAQSFAYVTNELSNSVSVINTATNNVVATVGVGNAPEGLAVTPDGSLIYVANTGDGSVSVISTATNSVVANISVGSPASPLANIDGVAVTPNGAFAYVTNFVDNTVTVISTADNAITATLSLAGAGDVLPSAVAFTPSGQYAYVVSKNSVSVISTANNSQKPSRPRTSLCPSS